MLAGLDIGGTKCAVVFGDENGNIMDKIKFPTVSKDDALEKFTEILDSHPGFDAVGISCGGPLDEKRGIILAPPSLPDWDGVPIADMMSSRYKVPAALRNDANACALAEHRFGAGKGTENMIFLTFGTGMGAGLILNGKLYSGTNGNAGEVGHMRIAPIGPSGYGKIGSFEGFCSGNGVREVGRALARQSIQTGVTPLYAENGLDSFTAAEIADAARNGDKTASECFRFCGEMLGKGLSVLIDLFNPELIVIGSVFARCEELLRPSMEKSVSEEALGFAAKVCRIVPAGLGEHIGDMAALAVAADIMNGR